MLICSDPTCGRSALHADGGRRGLCQTHYKRLQSGMPEDVRVYRSRVGKRTHAEILSRNVDGDKRCTGCLRWLPERGFRNATNTIDKLAAQCAGCFVSRAHGMASELEYESLLEVQDGLCAICDEPPAEGERLCIDHDRQCCPGSHSCGQCIRGLLCRDCNAGIGFLGDTPEPVRRAYMYLMGTSMAERDGPQPI